MPANVATADQLSILFDITVRHVLRLTAKGILMRLQDEDGRPVRGRYNLIVNVRAYCQYLREQARLDDLNESAYRELRNKRLAAETEIATLKLKLFKRKLHRTEDVEFVMTTMLTAVKNRPLAIPARTSRLLIGKTAVGEIYGLLYGEIELALRELADYNPDTFAQQNEEYLASVNAAFAGVGPNGNGEDSAVARVNPPD